MKTTLFLMLFITTSCANYIDSIHRQINKDQRSRSKARTKKMYPMRYSDKRPIENPITLGGPSTASRKNYLPNVQRQYSAQGKRRYRASDLLDNKREGSLWNHEKGDNFLFINNSTKKRGDFVILEVMQTMKSKIQEELKRAFPDPPKRKAKKVAKKEDSEDKDKNKEVASEKEKPESGNKVYDKISTQVVEKINKDYLLLRGRKEVIFKKNKRYVEVQVIAPAKDINANDSVSSEKILEPRITILRY